jgi:alginate biosynthesis protein AlgK
MTDGSLGMRAAGTLAVAAALVAAGCAAPDLQRGKARIEAGDMEAAEADLAPLAELGFEDAKVQLARVYAKSGDPEQQQEAIALYKEMLKNDPSVAVPLARMLMESPNETALTEAENILLKSLDGKDPRAYIALLELYSDHPQRDGKKRAPALAEQVAKVRTAEAEVAVIKWYRRNALADERYAKALVQRCEDARDRLPDCYVDLARHYRASGNDKALGELTTAATRRFTTGSLPPPVLEKLGWSLVSEDIPGTPRPEAAQPMLKRAAEVSDTARVRLARLLIEYPHLDPEGNPEQLLLKAAGRGNPEASLALGRLYLDGKLAAADPAKALKYFEQAAATEPAAHYYLGRIYKRGYLGRPDPVLAARHFLTAARGGYARADQALAQLFSDNRGVKPNLPNALVFATIAAEHQTPEGALMLKQIRALMKPAQLQEADRLLRQELAVRGDVATTATAAAPAPRAVPTASLQPPSPKEATP